MLLTEPNAPDGVVEITDRLALRAGDLLTVVLRLLTPFAAATAGLVLADDLIGWMSAAVVSR